jgi:hypothetical protein
MDIDILNPVRDYTEDVHDLIKVIQEFHPNADVKIYISHRDTKQSFHLVIRNVACYDNVQCKHRIELILAHKPEIAQFIDMDVYRSFQLLRILGSSKIDIENVKISSSEYSDMENMIRDSLVTNIQEDTIILPDLDVKYKQVNMRFQARRCTPNRTK